MSSNSRRRKSRWGEDEERGGRSDHDRLKKGDRTNYTSSGDEYKRKSRSRSPPVKYSSDPIEVIDVRSLINQNNNYTTTPNGHSLTNTSVKFAGSGIQMKLMQPIVKPAAKTPVVKPKIASVFNVDDDEEEEMPLECKMRMKNIGRETPTSAGPNSFGKTKMGFCNTIQIKERKLEEELLKKK